MECGGLDGERSSNTYLLEKLGWKGILIEADPFFFLQSLGKNRRAWKLNAALCPSGKTSIVSIGQDTMGYFHHIGLSGAVNTTGHICIDVGLNILVYVGITKIPSFDSILNRMELSFLDYSLNLERALAVKDDWVTEERDFPAFPWRQY